MTTTTKILTTISAAAMMSAAAFSVSAQQGDAARGEQVFRKCKACHKIGEGAKNAVGPNLTGVVGRPMGSSPGFRYGSGLKAANEAGGVWDQEMIVQWLAGPKDYIQGYTGDAKAKARMTFRLKDEEDRRDVAAFLATFSEMSEEAMPDEEELTHGFTPFNENIVPVQTEADMAGLKRVKQELVMPPAAPAHDQVASAEPRIVEIELEVQERKLVIDQVGTQIVALTFNGSVPGPMIVVHEGDYVDLTLTNPATNTMIHNIDLHAATGALGGAGLTTVAPGEQARFVFKADRAGAFTYHCAPEGTMTPYHVTHGMNGVIMVLPREGLKGPEGEALSYDKLFYIAEQDYYVPTDENGAFISYDVAGADFGGWVEQMRTLTPSHIVFNGAAGSLTGDNALTAKVGETALFIHSQANRDTRPHLIGGHGDFVWEEGAFSNPPMKDLETWFVRGGSAGAALYTFRQPGVYVYLNHNLIEAVEFGAAAHVVVEGEWDNSLMQRTYHGPIQK